MTPRSIHSPVALGLVLVLSACGGQSEATWMRGFGLRWNLLNHRLSQAAVVVEGDGARAAFIGGASTTGCVFVQGEGCVEAIPEDDQCLDAGSCGELPLKDHALVAVDRVVAEARGSTALGSGVATIQVGPSGASGTVLVELPYPARGDAVAWIRGLALTTDVPKPADSASCYDPRHGWLPSRIQLSVGEPVEEGRTLWSVPVEALFQAGLTDEALRQCLDAVVDEAAIALRVEVAMAVGAEARTTDVSQSAQWARGDSQVLSDLGDLTADVGPVSGWRSVDWQFHTVVEPGRGAYLRSLAAWIAPDEGLAYGVATNDSLTQLSGFDVAFSGEVVTLEGLELVEEGVWGLDEMPTTLSEDGAAVIHDLEEGHTATSFTE